MEVEYFEHPDIPGQKRFKCERLAANLAVSDCKARWQRAKDFPTDTRFFLCRNCPLGAQHAGHANEAQAFTKRICARCNELSRRLIGGELCPSCYNRDRELRLGVVTYRPKPRMVWFGDTAEGKERTHVVQTFRARCGVVDSKGPRIFEAEVAHPQELHIRAMRSSKEPVRLFFAVPARMAALAERAKALRGESGGQDDSVSSQ